MPFYSKPGQKEEEMKLFKGTVCDLQDLQGSS